MVLELSGVTPKPEPVHVEPGTFSSGSSRKQPPSFLNLISLIDLLTSFCFTCYLFRQAHSIVLGMAMLILICTLLILIKISQAMRRIAI